MSALERLIRVRRVRHRLAMAALGQAQSRTRHEAALAARVSALVTGFPPAHSAAAAVNARHAANTMLAGLADDLARRLQASLDDRDRRALAVARAQAAVDAAVARLAERDPT